MKKGIYEKKFLGSHLSNPNIGSCFFFVPSLHSSNRIPDRDGMDSFGKLPFLYYNGVRMDHPNMEKMLMKTAEDIIIDFQELAHDQQKKVIQFVISVKEQEETNVLNKAIEEEYIQEENYSPEDMAKILQAGEEAKQGINMSGPFVGEEAINHLRRLRKAKF